MSTPSFIGVLYKEGIIKFVYCHSDGYPSYLGKMLLEHYNTQELATALVDLGSLSMVRERLAPDEGETHRFDTPVRHGPKGGVTTAYHRDRGDDLEIDSEVVDTPVVLKNAETLFLNILKEENMSYGFDMGFAQANSLQEAMAIALEYTQSQMTEKNIRKTIRDNRYYIPSVRTGYIADEENKNRRADVLADTADRYWLEALFTFRFLYWEEHKLLGIIMMPPESASERWPLSVYFQNSCDQDYPFFEWKEGNIPFFANAAAKAENYTAEEIRAKFDYEIEDENLEYYRRNTCYNDIFEELALESWLYNHCTDVPFVTFALQGIQNEAERYRYLQWLKAEIQ